MIPLEQQTLTKGGAMQPTPRYQEIVAVLRAMLAVPGIGPHLSRYWQYCPEQKVLKRNATGDVLYTDGPAGARVPEAMLLPPAFTFLEWLYVIGLAREPNQGQEPGALKGIGRQAFYALLAPLGPIITRTAPNFEEMPLWLARLPSDRAREFPEHLQVMFRIAEHYLTAELAEDSHRQCIPVEVVAALPWNEVTVPWLVEADTSEPWYRKRDPQTVKLIVWLITTSFTFDARFATAFWNAVGVEDLLERAAPDWRRTFHRRMRREGLTFSDAVLAANFPIQGVVAHVPSERIETYLGTLFAWLGGSEFPQQDERTRKTPPMPPLANGNPPPPPPDAVR